MVERLLWLASYPKSGNTWLRAFLSNYEKNSDEAVPIHELLASVVAACRESFDHFYRLDSTMLSWNEIDMRRSAMYVHWTGFHKVHDAYTYLPDGRALLGDPSDQAAIYVIRNPLDVAVSISHHNGRDDLDKIIGHMNRETFALCADPNRVEAQLYQRLLSWSQHVLSWEKAPLPKLFVRFEDMLSKPVETFGQVIRFLKLPDDTERIERAVRLSSFDALRSQEEAIGYAGKGPAADFFFHRGQSGVYTDTLDDKQVRRIIQDHGEVMAQFAYF